ncbi:MAG: hypothetical protein AAFX93_13835 [Verrucomicrobiota bacterium]
MRKHLLFFLVSVLAVCYVHAQAPTPPNSNPPAINFDKTKDLFIPQFDSKPDPDDIHAMAALGSMLAHPDLHDVDYFAVQGSVGMQPSRTPNGYIPAPALMTMAFGPENVRWTQAGRGRLNTDPGTPNWNASVVRVRDKAKTALDRGGKVYVMEAGNSDFTRDWVQSLINNTSYTANDTRNRIVVVQHSNWNETRTTTTVGFTGANSHPAGITNVLDWVRNNTDYRRIEDGNGNNSTPNYRTSTTSFANQAEANNNPNTHARDMWREADRLIQDNGYLPGHSTITVGGVDYSDCVEAWYIFGLGTTVDNNTKFFNRYVTNSNSANGPVPGPAGSGTVYVEQNGLVIMETENTPSDLGLWLNKTAVSGYTGSGYLEFNGNNFELGPPNSPLTYEFTVSQSGLYYLHLHCARQVVNGRHDVANDCYVRVEGNYSAGPNAGNTHGAHAPLSMLKSDTKFFGGANNQFVWSSGNKLDPGGHNNKRVAIYNFQAGETYRLVVSGRSKFFKLDRIMFRHSSVPAATAENLNNPESSTTSGPGGGSNTVDCSLLPSSVVSSTSFDVQVPYEASGNREIVVVLSGPSGWLGNGKTQVSTGSGTASVTVNVAGGVAPAAGSGYTLAATNRVIGDGAGNYTPCTTALTFTNTLSNTADCSLLPSSVVSSTSFDVQVPYEASGNREIVVVLSGASGWLGNGKTQVSAGSGTASVTVNVAGGVAPAAGGGYTLAATNRVIGDGAGNYTQCTTALTFTNTLSNTADCSLLPSSVESATSFDVQVPYEAAGNREIVVVIGGPTGWLGNGKTQVTAGSGTAIVTVNVVNGGAPAAGGSYELSVTNRVPGDGSQANYTPCTSALTITAPGGGPATSNSADCSLLPTSLVSSTSFDVQVPYEATENREIVVVIGGPSGWLGNGKTPVAAGTGTATVTVNVVVGGTPAAGGGYQLSVTNRIPGDGNQGNYTPCTSALAFTSAGGTLVETPVQDAYIQGSTPFNNGDLKVEPNYRTSYLKFDVNGITGAVTEAKLVATLTESGNGTVRVYQGNSNGGWTEATITAGNAPGNGAELGSVTGAWAAGNTVEIDLGTTIGNGEITLVLEMDGGGNDVWYSSSEGANSPRLEVTYQ